MSSVGFREYFLRSYCVLQQVCKSCLVNNLPFSTKKSILHDRLALIALSTLRKAEKYSQAQAKWLNKREMKIFTRMATTNQNRLLTPEGLAEFEGHELYSQDGMKKDAQCITVFHIGNIRWYFLEGQKHGEDFIFYGVVLGLVATEYGYVSANEMASISIDASKYGLGILQVEQDKEFEPCQLSAIKDAELQEFLSNLYDDENRVLTNDGR